MAQHCSEPAAARCDEGGRHQAAASFFFAGALRFGLSRQPWAADWWLRRAVTWRRFCWSLLAAFGLSPTIRVM